MIPNLQSIYTKTCELTNDDLRALSKVSNKSVKNLKRLKEAHTYLMYSLTGDYYSFLGYTSSATMRPKISPEEFFDAIREHQLAKIL